MSTTTQQLEQKENQGLRKMMSYIPGGLHCCQDDGFCTMTHMSASFLSLLGYTRQEISDLFKNRFLFMIYPEDRGPVLNTLTQHLSGDDIVELEYRVIHKTGAIIWVLDKTRKVLTKRGRLLYCVLIDITQRKQEQEELRLSLERHQIIMNQTQDIIFEWDIINDKLKLSNNWNEKFGYTAIGDDASQKSLHSSNIHPADISMVKNMQEQLSQGIPYLETELRIKNSRDKFIWCRIRATTQFSHDGTPIKAIGVILDIQEEKTSQQRLVTMAETDALTGLYHKKAIQYKIEPYLQLSPNNCCYALIIVDLDNFKQVNDNYGHFCGDIVISSAARCIQEIFSPQDFIGRIGGDEFMIFVTDITNNKYTVATKAAQIAASIRQISIKEYPLAAVTCSIGIAFYPDDADTFTALYQCADQALYQTKAAGKNGYSLFEKSTEPPLIYTSSLPPTRTTIDSEKFSEINQTLAQYFFRMLYQSPDIETMIHHALEIVGRAYTVSRVYIFENSSDNRFCNNTFEWCDKGIQSEIENLQNLSYETDLAGFYDYFDDQGVFCCPDTSVLPSNLYECLKNQGVVSVLQCVIIEDGQSKGYIGFDECRVQREWTTEQVNSLMLISNVVSTFLLKLRYKERLQELIHLGRLEQEK